MDELGTWQSQFKASQNIGRSGFLGALQSHLPTTTSMNITTARPDDLEAILPYLDDAYGFAPGFFGERLAAQWNAQCVDWDGVFIVRGKDGSLDSLVRVWQLNLILDGRAITSGGIGSVSTAHHARGQGAMSALMNHAVEYIKARGWPLGILWGDRFRYATFGFENGGRALQWEVTKRGLKWCGIEPIEPLPFDDSTIERIEQVRAQMPYYRVREDYEIARLYRTPTRRVVAAGQGEQFGWLTLDQERTNASARLIEWGGAADTALRLAAYCARENIADSLSFATPASVEVAAPLRAAASGWSMHTAWCRANILDLPATLQALDCAELEGELSALDGHEQVWRLFGAPDAPRNIWMAPIDTI